MGGKGEDLGAGLAIIGGGGGGGGGISPVFGIAGI
jgi:hypothetical protein